MPLMAQTYKSYIKQGLQYAQNKQYKKALKAFLSAKKLSPYDANVHFYLGQVYIFLGDNENTIKYLRRAIQLYPFLRVRKGLVINPQFGYVYFFLGLAYYFEHKYDEAKTAYIKALKINPALKEAYYNLAVIYELQHNKTWALKNFERYIKEKQEQEVLEE